MEQPLQIRSPQGSSDAGGFTELNGKLYFSARDGESGTELWVTDGTSGGTQLLKDINTSDSYYGNSSPGGFIELNGKLYFSARDGESGTELWVTDGTSAGTVMVADINPGSAGSNPYNFGVLNNELFFSAKTEATGFELYKLTYDGSVDPVDPDDGTNGSDDITGTEQPDQIDGLNGTDTLDGGSW